MAAAVAYEEAPTALEAAALATAAGKDAPTGKARGELRNMPGLQRTTRHKPSSPPFCDRERKLIVPSDLPASFPTG